MPISTRPRKRKLDACSVGTSTTSTPSRNEKACKGTTDEKQSQTTPKLITCGTSGYSYAHWKGVFYPKGYRTSDKQWEYYSNEFDSVELNASFYRWHKRQTWQLWRQKAQTASTSGRVFTYAIKSHQYFTHWRRLTVDSVFAEKFRGFVDDCRVLGPHFGPLLLQFPARFECNETTLTRLEQFGQLVRDINNETGEHPPLRVALEFRNHSWYKSKVYKVAKQYNLCICLVHLVNRNPAKWADGMCSGFSPTLAEYPYGSCDWGLYARFHGTRGQYEGSYPDHVLDEFLAKCQGRQLYVFFNNTDDGNPPSAIRDARYICQVSQS